MLKRFLVTITLLSILPLIFAFTSSLSGVGKLKVFIAFLAGPFVNFSHFEFNGWEYFLLIPLLFYTLRSTTLTKSLSIIAGIVWLGVGLISATGGV